MKRLLKRLACALGPDGHPGFIRVSVSSGDRRWRYRGDRAELADSVCSRGAREPRGWPTQAAGL